jgi:hypothetical protein
MLFGPDLVVDGMLSGPDVGLGGLDKLGALENLPESVQSKVNWNVDISGQEISRRPLSLDEDTETVEDNDDAEVNKSKVRSVWLPLGLEHQGVAINTLRDERSAESEVCNSDGHPCKELSNGDEILEPQEDVVGASADTHVGKK